MDSILQMIVIVSRMLQSPNTDLIAAMSSIYLSEASVKLRNNDNEFNNIYKKVVNTCYKMKIAISEIRKRKISVKIDN